MQQLMMTQYHLEWLLPQEAMLMDKLIMEHHNYFLIYRNQFQIQILKF
jgi:hypothetical protein